MKTMAWLRKQILQKRNRIVFLVTKLYRRLVLRAKLLLLYFCATVMNLLGRGEIASVPPVEIPCSDGKTELLLNCMGAVDSVGAPSCIRNLSAVRDVIQAADLSLAICSSQKEAAAGSDAPETLASHGVTLLRPEKKVASRIFNTSVGPVAVITYDRSLPSRNTNDDKLHIMQHILAAKKARVGFIIVYINKGKDHQGTKKSESSLYKMICQMGADYIIGILPERLDGGTTYKRRGGDIVRGVFSVGTFLSADDSAPKNRVILRLKLVLHRGKVLVKEETYLPYHKTETGLVSLLDNGNTLPGKQARALRAEIEVKMRRIRPADRILTVGTVLELSGASLPEELRYLQDFSVGKVCARSFEVMPGDIFFFREPFQDPNDLEPVNPKRRLRIAKRAAKKAPLLLVSFQALPFPCKSVVCGNAMEAHIAVCAHLRRHYDMSTVAITGSIGKTSTKDMLAEVMGMRYNTVKNQRNTNVQVTIGENLQKLDSACEVYIQEIGGGRPGGASRHARMVLPQVAVVTNIGDAHIGNFGSKEKLMENKLGITEGLTADGTLYLNGDDPLLKKAAPGCKTVFYAVHNRSADYYAENLSTFGGYCTFDIVHGDHTTPVRLNVLGEYNVLNAVCCFAIGKQYGIPEADIVQGLARFHTAGVRQNLMEVCGRKLFMDCYNASLDSVRSALEMLMQIRIEDGKKRIAVIGDVTGIGDLSKEQHREIGQLILQYPVDHVLLFGEAVAHTYEVLRGKRENVSYITKREELNEALRTLVDVGDGAMFKGSSKMLLEYSVDTVFGTRLTDQRLKDEREYKYLRKGSVIYDLFSSHATAEEYSPIRSGERRVQIAARVGGIEVVNMGRALQGQHVAEVILPDSIRHISAEAFRDCAQLTVLRMPKKLKYIGNGAFRNCGSLREMEIPDQVIHIGKEAFAGCRGLQKITIPSGVVQIGKDAFADCGNCRFVCPKGSYAEQYLLEAGLLAGSN